jgi:two-component SAPR family response regulator
MAIIVVYDEEWDYGLLLKRLLEASGHDVTIHADQEEIMEWIIHNTADLVIINSPRESERVIDLAHRLTVNNDDLKLMAISNHFLAHTGQSDFHDILVQPLDLGTIQYGIDRVLSGATSTAIQLK